MSRKPAPIERIRALLAYRDRIAATRHSSRLGLIKRRMLAALDRRISELAGAGLGTGDKTTLDVPSEVAGQHQGDAHEHGHSRIDIV